MSDTDSPNDDKRKRKRKSDERTEELRKRVAKLGYRPAEAAVALGWSLPTVNRRIADGTLPSTKVGGIRNISADTIEKMLSHTE